MRGRSVHCWIRVRWVSRRHLRAVGARARVHQGWTAYHSHLLLRLARTSLGSRTLTRTYTSFHKCPAGSSTNNVMSATSCSPCEAGRASTNDAGENAGTEGCKICAAGKSAAFGQFVCASCEAGRYSAEPGSATCEACQAGRISSSESSSLCETCEPGKSAAGAGQSQCLACEHGRYSAEPGSATCEACQAGTFSSTEGLDACEPCPAGEVSRHTQVNI